MSTRHLWIKADERLNLDDSRKSVIRDHLRSRHQSCNRLCSVTSFKVLRKGRTDYDTKIHEALLIKKN